MGGKTAIVTGGSRGIGRAIAEELAGIGYDLVLLAKDKSRLNKASAEIEKQYKIRVDAFPCDLSDTKDIDAFEKFCKEKKIIPDVLVNNAGIWIPATTGESSIKEYNEIMDTNTKGMFYLTQKLLPSLKQGNDQRIIIISSMWAQDSHPANLREEATIYAMSKWALRGWGRMLREELRKHNIGVTVIYPGGVLTDEWEGTTIPKEKFIKPEDIGRLVRAVVEMSPSASIDEVIINPKVGDLRST